jgi:Tfp pilus assembly protein PilW
LGLVELMISLAIVSTLLTATAAAINASLKAYEINQEQSSLIQRARVALNHMVTSVRTTQSHAPDTSTLSAQFAAGQVVTDSGIDMYDLSNNLLIYRFDATNQRLLAVTSGHTYTMAEGVSSFQVKMEPMQSAQSARTGGSWDLLRRATITISVQTNANTSRSGETSGQQVVTLSASVMPRANSW